MKTWSPNHWTAKVLPKSFHFGLGDLLPDCAENLTNPWLEWVNETIPVNESNNSAILVGVIWLLLDLSLL